MAPSSCATVAIGLLAAVALPVPVLHSMAFGGLPVPLVSVAVALKLFPVMSRTLGPRADRRRLRGLGADYRHRAEALSAAGIAADPGWR